MQTNKIKLTLIMVIVLVAMTACSFPLLISPTIDPFIPDTGLDGTLDARLTEVWNNAAATMDGVATSTPVPPTNTPVHTNTPIPTNTPLPTNSPVPTEPPLPCNAAKFVSDQTVVDGVYLPVKSPFFKIWRLENIGSCTWTKEYEVSFDGGDKLGGKTISLPYSVPPGDIVNITIPMKTPDSAGRYKGYWILRNQIGTKFGIGVNADTPFYIEINVVDGDSSAKYNLANKICKADWKTDTHTLPCLGNSQIYSNYVYYSSDFKMEDGRTEDEPAVIANVETGKRLRGFFPHYTVESGDHFVTEIGCISGDTSCKVKMMLRYRIKGTSTQGILGEWIEEYDGKTTMVDVDLSSLTGEEVIFILDMEAKSDSDSNEVFWFMPSIKLSPTEFEPK